MTRNGKPADLARLRAGIEKIDRAVIGLIRDRVRLARRLGAAKQAGGLPHRDAAQEDRVIGRAIALGRRAGLSAVGVRRVFRELIGLTRRAAMKR